MSELNALLLRSVLATVGEAIVTIDGSSTIVMVNNEAQRIWGYSEEELVGQPLVMLMPERYREAHAVGLQRYLETGAARFLGHRLELEGLKKDGSVFPLELRIQETLANGNLYFTGAVRDLTQRKAVERRVTAEHRVTRVLASAEDLGSATPQILSTICECLGWQVGALWQTDRQANVLRCLELWHQDSAEVAAFEDTSRSKIFKRGEGLPGRIWAQGESLWIKQLTADNNFPRAAVAARAGLHSAFGFPIRLGGEVLGIMEFFSHEIREPDPELLAMMDAIGSQLGQFMERIEAEADRTRLISELQDALQTRDRFLSIAAHELKTPVSSLVGYAQLLERRAERITSTNPRDLKALQALTSQAQRLQRLLTSLLDLSRMQSGQLTIEPASVDLAGLTRRAVEEMQPLLERHTLQLYGDEQPLIVQGDELRLEQVLHNLLQNAVKYSPEGGPIEVEVAEQEGQALVRVKDRGIGIPESAMKRLFSRFFRAGNANQRQIAGMGIGLYLVKEIVSLHDGTIGVDSSEGEGTTFTVRLPLSAKSQEVSYAPNGNQPG